MKRKVTLYMTVADALFEQAIAEAEAFKEQAKCAGLTQQEALALFWFLQR